MQTNNLLLLYISKCMLGCVCLNCLRHLKLCRNWDSLWNWKHVHRVFTELVKCIVGYLCSTKIRGYKHADSTLLQFLMLRVVTFFMPQPWRKDVTGISLSFRGIQRECALYVCVDIRICAFVLVLKLCVCVSVYQRQMDSVNIVFRQPHMNSRPTHPSKSTLCSTLDLDG